MIQCINDSRVELPGFESWFRDTYCHKDSKPQFLPLSERNKHIVNSSRIHIEVFIYCLACHEQLLFTPHTNSELSVSLSSTNEKIEGDKLSKLRNFSKVTEYRKKDAKSGIRSLSVLLFS